MLNRKDNNLKFILSKEHSIEYYKHSYFKNYKSYQNLINGKLKKEEWDNDSIKSILIKNYFIENINATEEECIIFFKNRLLNIYNKSDNNINYKIYH